MSDYRNITEVEKDLAKRLFATCEVNAAEHKFLDTLCLLMMWDKPIKIAQAHSDLLLRMIYKYRLFLQLSDIDARKLQNDTIQQIAKELEIRDSYRSG